MTIQSSVQIGNVIRNAVVFNVKNWLGGTMNSDSLIQSVQDFFAVLGQRQERFRLCSVRGNCHPSLC